MAHLKKDLSHSVHTTANHSIHFSQSGSLEEPVLIQLRDEIKTVMIPLLIKAFHYQTQLAAAPYKTEKEQSDNDSMVQIHQHLKALDHDLTTLQQWCNSCQIQVRKALECRHNEHKTVVSDEPLPLNPTIAKSFSAALHAQTCCDDSLIKSYSLKSWMKRLFNAKNKQ